jgi:hypothetical protein
MEGASMGKYKVLRNKPTPKVASWQGWLLPVLAVTITLVVIGVGLWWRQSRPTSSFVPQVTGRPQATLDQTTFDYGDVKLGTTIQTVFRVQNTGDRPLAFLGDPWVEVREGC